MGKIADNIRKKVSVAFSPTRLEIVDDSDKHHGHAGASEAGESHFTLTIVAAAFEGVSRVERQRMINKVLAEELAGPVHALSIKAEGPSGSL